MDKWVSFPLLAGTTAKLSERPDQRQVDSGWMKRTDGENVQLLEFALIGN